MVSLISLGVWSCWEMDNAFDQQVCAPSCGTGTICYQGNCVDRSSFEAGTLPPELDGAVVVQPDFGVDSGVEPAIGSCTSATAVDILVVVDNSASMNQEQENLRNNIGNFIEGLRSVKFGSDGSGKPCSENDKSGCAPPDLHIGVISTDIGAGTYGTGNCATEGGDGGKLQNAPQVPGCTPPTDPYISYSVAAKINVPDGESDALTSVKNGFACIAELGTNGCGYEQPLEAMRLALDPTLATNPGFLRDDALLAVIVISDEDDCSAADSKLFDQQDATPGPLNFRCFADAAFCDGKPIDLEFTGELKNCTANEAPKYLSKVQTYLDLLTSLKSKGHLIVSLISGPTSPVVVKKNADGADLESACSSAQFGFADPGIRLNAFVQPFVDQGVGLSTSICAGDINSALAATASLINSCVQ